MNPSNNGSLPIKTDPTLKPIAPNVDAANLMKNWGFSSRFIDSAPNILGWFTLEDVCSSLMGDDTQDFSEELRGIGVAHADSKKAGRLRDGLRAKLEGAKAPTRAAKVITILKDPNFTPEAVEQAREGREGKDEPLPFSAGENNRPITLKLPTEFTLTDPGQWCDFVKLNQLALTGIGCFASLEREVPEDPEKREAWVQMHMTRKGQEMGFTKITAALHQALASAVRSGDGDSYSRAEVILRNEEIKHGNDATTYYHAFAALRKEFQSDESIREMHGELVERTKRHIEVGIQKEGDMKASCEHFIVNLDMLIAEANSPKMTTSSCTYAREYQPHEIVEFYQEAVKKDPVLYSQVTSIITNRMGGGILSATPDMYKNAIRAAGINYEHAAAVRAVTVTTAVNQLRLEQQSDLQMRNVQKGEEKGKKGEEKGKKPLYLCHKCGNEHRLPRDKTKVCYLQKELQDLNADYSDENVKKAGAAWLAHKKEAKDSSTPYNQRPTRNEWLHKWLQKEGANPGKKISFPNTTDDKKVNSVNNIGTVVPDVRVSLKEYVKDMVGINSVLFNDLSGEPHGVAREVEIKIVDDVGSNSIEGVAKGKKWSPGGTPVPAEKYKAMYLFGAKPGPGRDDNPQAGPQRIPEALMRHGAHTCEVYTEAEDLSRAANIKNVERALRDTFIVGFTPPCTSFSPLSRMNYNDALEDERARQWHMHTPLLHLICAESASRDRTRQTPLFFFIEQPWLSCMLSNPIIGAFKESIGTSRFPVHQLFFNRCAIISGDTMKKGTAFLTNIPRLFLAKYGWVGTRSVCQCKGPHEYLAFGHKSSDSSFFTRRFAKVIAYATYDLYRNCLADLLQGRASPLPTMKIRETGTKSCLLDGGSQFSLVYAPDVFITAKYDQSVSLSGYGGARITHQLVDCLLKVHVRDGSYILMKLLGVAGSTTAPDNIIDPAHLELQVGEGNEITIVEGFAKDAKDVRITKTFRDGTVVDIPLVQDVRGTCLVFSKPTAAEVSGPDRLPQFPFTTNRLWSRRDHLRTVSAIDGNESKIPAPDIVSVIGGDGSEILDLDNIDLVPAINYVAPPSNAPAEETCTSATVAAPSEGHS